MSDLMLHAVLNMPIELWHESDHLQKIQRHSRYVQASERIKEVEQALEEMLNKFECRNDNLFSQRLACTKARKILEAGK